MNLGSVGAFSVASLSLARLKVNTPCGVRLFSTSFVPLSKNSRLNDNAFLLSLELKCKELYNDLPNNSVLKRSDSLVNKRIKLSNLEVLQNLYGLNSDKDIQDFFTVPEKLDVPGIYCFMSKDRSDLSYYIGSSVNMRGRYNRHMSNLNHKDTRNSQASPKFYNYVRKYGIEALDFGCLLVTLDYTVMFNGFNLSPKEISFLKSLTQLDLLLTEQYFLDTYGLSLNVATYVGTRESAVLSEETRKKMSDAHLNLEVTLSKDKWEAIRAKAKEAWENEPLDSERRKMISALHGRSVIIKDSDHNVIEEFTSQLKTAEFLGVNRNKVARYLNTGNLLDTDKGPVYVIGKEQIKARSIKIQVFDVNRNLLDSCNSIRAAAKKYNVPLSTISATYLNKDKLYRNKYYFVSESNIS